MILDRVGVQVYSNGGHVPIHAWADSLTILEVEGRPVEGGVGFDFEAAYLTNVLTGERRTVAVPEIPRKLQRAAFDGAIYLHALLPSNGAVVFRLDLPSGLFEPTTHHDLNFSPTGRFYYHEPDEGDPIARVYDARTDTEVAHPEFTGVVAGWADSIEDQLVFAPARRAADRGLPITFQVFNPTTGQLARLVRRQRAG